MISRVAVRSLLQLRGHNPGGAASDSVIQTRPTTVVGWRGQGSADTQSHRVNQMVVRSGLKGLVGRVWILEQV
jgi:hypothetical protein